MCFLTNYLYIWVVYILSTTRVTTPCKTQILACIRMLVWWIHMGGVLGFWHYKTLLKPDSKHFVMQMPKNHIAFRWFEKNKPEHHPCKPPTNHWLWSMQKTRNKKNTNLNQQPTIDWPNQDFRLSIVAVVGIIWNVEMFFSSLSFSHPEFQEKKTCFFPTTKGHQKKPLTTDLFYFSTSGRRRSQPFRTSSGSNNRSRWRHMASGEVPTKPPKPIYNWIGFDLFPLNQKTTRS